MALNLPGFRIGDRIHVTPLASVYRAVRESDAMDVVIKTLNAEYPSNQDVAEIRREYRIAEKLQGVGGVISVHSLETYGYGNLAIVMEPFGVSLAQFMQQRGRKPLSLKRFLDIAISIARAIGGVHQENVVHKDVIPRNILLDPGPDEIRLVDFGISSELSRERQDINISRRLEGSLPYISPEQTGRMNRDLDYRSDYYSLGVTYYELVTGQLPFEADSVLEWVHSHISKSPPVPRQVNPAIPEVLSGLILKLMSKNAEDRYQSTYGLVSDLERCREQLDRSGEIGKFALGQADVSEHFQLSQKLYGRKEELSTLMNLFEKVASGSCELCMVSGYSGVGKSALVNEIIKPIVRRKGHLIQGKFDQFQRNTPYSAIAIAFRSLARQLLAESGTKLEFWRQAIVGAVGPNGRIMTDLVPELEQIIGEQEPIPELPLTEAQNRFQIVLLNFVKLFASREYPLVIFLDDLQWCDAPTLNLIQKLVTSRELSHLFFIGAYRSNEVDVGHPLILTLNEIQQVKPTWDLPLEPLDQASVNQLVADTLRSDPQDSQPLGELLYQKAEGNPFFINELLKSLHEDGAISFSPGTGQWAWDIETVQRSAMSGNVVEFVVSNLRKLPPVTQQVLQLASCIGNTFDLRTLSIIHERTMEETSDELLNALKKNMLIPLDEDYKFVAGIGADDSTESAPLNPSYRFQHDRVQQAAYALIDADRKQEVHLSIGRLIQQHASADEIEEHLIDITGHLNEGRRLISDPVETEELAGLNLRAGIKAQQSSAYQSALEYLQTGQELLSENPWKDQYELALALNTEFQKCAYLTGRYEDAEAYIEKMLGKVRTNLEKAEILSMRTRQYATIGKMEESIKAAIMGLKLLGMKITDDPGRLAIRREALLVRLNLGRRKIPDLIDAPQLTDPGKLIAIRLLMEIFPAAFLSGSGNLFPFLVLKSVNISLRHGNSPESAFAYAAYGMLLCGELDQPGVAFEYGKLAVAMNDQFKDIKLKSRVIYVYGMFIHHWSRHWSTMTPWFRKGIEAGYQSGDLLYLAYSAQDCIIWDPRKDLETSCEEQKKYLTIVRDCEYQDSLDSGTLFLQMQLNFRGLTDGLYSMNDESFNESRCVDGMRRRKFMTGIANYHIYKAEICFCYENYDKAMEHIREQDGIIKSSMSLPQLVRFYLVAFMTRAARIPGLSAGERNRTRKRLKKDLRKMSAWARHCPENFLHIQRMMEAELARLSGRTNLAMERYEQAIEAAKEHEFRRDEALANELFARFFLAAGQARAAEGYLRAARYLYYRLGADRKVEHMEEAYPQLLGAGAEKKPEEKAGVTDRVSATHSSVVDSATLDLTSVMKASRAISGEIVLEQLWKTMMQILLENAGGQNGFFVLKKDGQLVIEAQGRAGGDEIASARSTPVEVEGEDAGLPVSLINYVLRTQEHVVLDNAAESGQFSIDPYIVKNRPQSVICFPMQRHGQFEGVIYLENNLTTGAFTEDRLEMMKLLSAQASISIENAQLYTNLEQKVQERTLELTRTLNDLKKAQSQLVQSEKMAGLGTLVAGVAHEINNPTNFVGIGASSLDEDLKEFKGLLFNMLGEENDPEVIQHFTEQFDRFFLALENIKEGTKRIRTIVNDLRTFSRIDEAEKKTVPLVENIESTLRLVRAQYDKVIDFVCDFRDNPEIDCFPAQLNQVFLNLMMNACQAIQQKHRQSGGGDSPESADAPQGTLTIGTRARAGAVAIYFQDTGTGMSPEVQQKVFEPFFTTKEVGEGTGMGMSISYQIVEKHQGRFEIESEVGKGTTITIILPM